MSIEAIVFGVLTVIMAVLVIAQEYLRPCKECNGKLRLGSMKDPAGINIGKKITISLWNGPSKKNYVYKCNNCDYEVTQKSWWY